MYGCTKMWGMCKFSMYSYNVQYENGLNIFSELSITLLLKVEGNFKHKK